MKKPEKDTMPVEAAKDEALFEALGKSKKRRKRRILITVLVIILVVAVALVIAVNILRKNVEERFNSMSGEVLSYTANTGTISTVVSGSGTLENVDTETVSVPEGVQIDEILVQFGDTVQAGDLLAIANVNSVKTALAQLQDTIDELDQQISEAEGDTVSSYIKSGVSGRVKILYAQEDQKVVDVMMEQGALAVLSLDGYMAVDIACDSLAAGDTVTVARPDGSTLTGSVEAVVGGTATVLVTDNGPAYDEEVTVQTQDGAALGAGKLYIHNPLSVTGYAGTVDTVYVKENSKVYDGTKLFYLTDTQTRANYDVLLRDRSDAEQTLLELLQIQKDGGVVAPISGSVYAVADLEEEEAPTDIVTLSPDEKMSVTIIVDEADILALELDQVADITVSSVTEETLSGVVTEIDKTASSGYYTAKVLLDKIDGMLPGMTAEVDVRIRGVDNALIIPIEAVHQTSTGAYVYTSYDPELKEYGGKTDVVVGLQGSNYVEIKSGLQVGDVVYYTETMTFMDMFMNMTGMGGGNTGGGREPGGNPGGQTPSGQIPEEYADQIPEGYAGQIPEGYGG